MSVANFAISGTTPAAPGTAQVGSVIEGLDDYEALEIVANLVGATGGTLDVYLQTNPSGDGATWVDYAHFAQLAAGAAATEVAMVVTLDQPTAAPAVVGQGLTPAMATTGAIGGPWGSSMRCVAKAGTGTTAGAAISITIAAQAKRDHAG